jgi:hypothetical protein
LAASFIDPSISRLPCASFSMLVIRHWPCFGP